MRNTCKLFQGSWNVSKVSPLRNCLRCIEAGIPHFCFFLYTCFLKKSNRNWQNSQKEPYWWANYYLDLWNSNLKSFAHRRPQQKNIIFSSILLSPTHGFNTSNVFNSVCLFVMRLYWMSRSKIFVYIYAIKFRIFMLRLCTKTLTFRQLTLGLILRFLISKQGQVKVGALA